MRRRQFIIPILFYLIPILVCYLLPALLLEPELNLEVGIAPHHKEERGVQAVQVAVIAPRQPDHLSAEGQRSQVKDNMS